METRAAQAPPRRSGTVPSVKTLTLRNRSGQVLFVPVVNDDGSSRNVRLGAGQSITVAEDRLTDYTQRMADKGQLTIRPLR